MSWCQESAGLLLACCHAEPACPGWAASLWDREDSWPSSQTSGQQGWVSQCGASHHLLATPDPLRALEPMTLALAGKLRKIANKTSVGIRQKEPPSNQSPQFYPFPAFFVQMADVPRTHPTCCWFCLFLLESA